MKLSDCCWCDYEVWQNGKVFCNACGSECKIINVTQKMIDYVERSREAALKMGYTEEE